MIADLKTWANNELERSGSRIIVRKVICKKCQREFSVNKIRKNCSQSVDKQDIDGVLCRSTQDVNYFQIGGEIMNENYLRGRIISMYHSVLNFGKALKWSSRKTYAIVSGKQEPTSSDIDAMCTALNVQIPEEMRLLFFSS